MRVPGGCFGVPRYGQCRIYGIELPAEVSIVTDVLDFFISVDVSVLFHAVDAHHGYGVVDRKARCSVLACRRCL